MRIIGRYVLTSFLITFLASLTLLISVMSIGVILRITDLIARGVPWWPLLKVFGLSMPAAMSFGIPVSLLATSLLVFSRLSADSEITAMKTCGISMGSILSRPLMLSLPLMLLCLAINSYVDPMAVKLRRAMIAQLGALSPLDMLEEGRFIEDFDGLSIHIGRRTRGELRGIRIIDDRDPTVHREIYAESGAVTKSDDGRDLILDLHNVRVDPLQKDRPVAATMDAYQVRIANAMAVKAFGRRAKDMTIDELRAAIGDVARFFPNLAAGDRVKKRLSLIVELNKRFVLSAACFAFVLLGSTLGVRSHRSESSIGIAISLMAMFFFYMFIVLAETYAQNPRVHPEMVIWIPVFVSLAVGLRLLKRLN